MNQAKYLMLAAFLTATTACSPRAYQGAYEGFRMSNHLRTTPSESWGNRDPMYYPQYDQLRKDRLAPAAEVPASRPSPPQF